MANNNKRDNDPEILTTRKGERLMSVPGIDVDGRKTTFYIILNHEPKGETKGEVK